MLDIIIVSLGIAYIVYTFSICEAKIWSFPFYVRLSDFRYAWKCIKTYPCISSVSSTYSIIKGDLLFEMVHWHVIQANEIRLDVYNIKTNKCKTQCDCTLT